MNQLKHGCVTQPKSRAVIAHEKGELLDDYIPYALESGKFFPERRGGLPDPLAATDVLNTEPPADGLIASAGNPVAAILDEPGTDRWTKHDVTPGQSLEVIWEYMAAHKARRWKAYITKENWDPENKLARDQFNPDPLWFNELRCQPYWDCHDLQMDGPMVLQLPSYHGYHVLLMIWEIADTGHAYYQVIDLKFS